RSGRSSARLLIQFLRAPNRQPPRVDGDAVVIRDRSGSWPRVSGPMRAPSTFDQSLVTYRRAALELRFHASPSPCASDGARSHGLTVASPPPMATNRPSEENPTQQASDATRKATRSRPEATSQI